MAQQSQEFEFYNPSLPYLSKVTASLSLIHFPSLTCFLAHSLAHSLNDELTHSLTTSLPAALSIPFAHAHAIAPSPQGDDDGPYAKMSTWTLVFLVFESPPASATSIDSISVTLSGASVGLQAWFPPQVGGEGTNRGTLVVQAPGSTASGAVQGLITFEGYSPIAWTLVYYDDSKPAIVGLAPSAGPHIGGTTVYITLARFPAGLSLPSDVVVTVGTASLR